MTIFRLLLIIITMILVLKLFHKILVKRNIMEGMTDIDKKNEYDKLNSLYGTGITLSPYNFKNSSVRPAPISSTDTANNANYIQNKTVYQANLDTVKTQLRNLTVIQPPVAAPIQPVKPNQWWMQSIYNVQMITYQSLLSVYNNTKSSYDSYITSRDNYNRTISQYEAVLVTIQTYINNYNNTAAAYQLALDDYNRLNDDSDHLNFRLKDLFIKSSYNSAFTGTCMNSQMIAFVLQRGCRYIDFEVIKIDGILYVSSDGLEKDNCITLGEAIGTINASLFGIDPLFINLRLVNPADILPAELQAALSSLTTAKLRYVGRRIDDTTRISEVQKQCIVICDYKDLSSVVDMVVNENGICSYLNSEIQSLAPVVKDCESRRLTVVNPDIMRSGVLSWLDPTELNLKLVVTSYRVNIIPFRFYLKTSELDEYEYIFDDNKRTIIQQKYLDTKFFEKMETAMDLVKQNIS